MFSTVFRSNSCIRFPESSLVYKHNSDKSLQGCVELCKKYDENRYVTLNNDNNVLESHPNISIALDKYTKKKVVIKKCRVLKNELNSLHKFNCNFIEKIIQYDLLQNIIIYNYNENKDLSEYIQKYPLTIEKSTKVVLNPILQALEFIHKKGYSHRDIKSENILYYDDGCKLIDFEFCEPLPECGYFSKRIGTLEFMAPEVTYSKGCLESDIWSLGIVYYECIHNTLPYHSINYDNLHQLFEQIRTKHIMINLDFDLSIIGIFKIMLSRYIDVRKKCYNKIYSLIKNIDCENLNIKNDL